jgi:transketolase
MMKAQTIAQEEALGQCKLDALCINTIRFLAVDAVEKAHSGHPGLPLGSASMAYVLWDRFLRFNPHDPFWPDRDRFVLSAGHGSMLLYALLHLTGYDVSLEELKQFRQWGSQTPGHPEYGRTPGVEATTGPLGQGFGNAVGMAIAERSLSAHYNRPGQPIVNHYTYALVSDGDLMEGISSEAASLAGHLQLGKLIVLYADNQITIEGSTKLAFTEDRLGRFAAFNWHVQAVEDGNDLAEIASAIEAARNETDRPSLIDVHTHLGYGSPNKQDTAKAHGEPLGEDEVRLTKENLHWPLEPTFHIPRQVLDHFREAIERGVRLQTEWENAFQEYSERFPDLAEAFSRVHSKRLPDDWDNDLPRFEASEGEIATRVASERIINQIAVNLPELIGGAADLAPSTHTLVKGGGNFETDNPGGRNLHFGIREHAMGAILNGIALHRGLRPYGATFLIFSDYMRPPMRLAAMNGLPVIYIFTHDSIGLGEDGPTHQPVEQLLGLRSVPGLNVIRPADANETALAWQVTIENQEGPVALILTRQKLPVLDLEEYPNLRFGLRFGGYILSDAHNGTRANIILVASGSEVHLALSAKECLAEKGIQARVVSFPSWELFVKQPESYQEEVLPQDIPVVAVEAGISLGWRPYIGPKIPVIGVDQFGASAPGEIVMREYGLTVENVCQHVLALLGKRGAET